MRGWHGGRMLIAVALLLICVATNSGVVPAANVPEFLASDPPDGATVAIAPTQVVLAFVRPVDPSMTDGYIHDVDGKVVSTAIGVNADDPTKVTLTLQPNLISGWDMVMWNTALVGTADPIAGSVEFNLAQ